MNSVMVRGHVTTISEMEDSVGCEGILRPESGALIAFKAYGSVGMRLMQSISPGGEIMLQGSLTNIPTILDVEGWVKC